MIVKTTPGGSHERAYRCTSYAVRGESGGSLATFLQVAMGTPWYKNTVNTFANPSRTISYDKGRQKFNYCHHDVDEIVVPTPYPESVYGYNDGTRWRGMKYKGHSDNIVWNPTPVITASDQMRKLAWQSLLPKLNDGFSLANFLWELRDLRTLGFSVSKLLKQMRLIKGSVPDRLLSTRTLAELILTYSFAIAPLHADIQTMLGGLFNTNKRVNEFIANGRRNLTYHYTNPLCGEVTGTRKTYWGEQVDTTQAVYHATLKCSYYYKKPSELEAFLRITGLRVTLENLWNAYPYSFVVDWVLKIADWLKQFDRDPFLTVYIKDYCDSIKMVCATTSFNDFGIGTYATTHPTVDGYADLVIGRHAVWSTRRSYYLREPGLPNTGYAFPVFDSLSNRELVLGGALLRTR